MFENFNFNVVAVFLAITVSGIAGGIGGALLAIGERETDDKSKTNGKGQADGQQKATPIPPRDPYAPEFLTRHVILGILAAYVVPLFLVLAAPGTNEGLMTKLLHPAKSTSDKSVEWWPYLFVLIGFCIIAALAAQRFLTSISSRVLALAEASSRKSDAANLKSEEAKRASDEAKRASDEADRKSDEAKQTAARVDKGLEMVQAHPEGPKQTIASASEATMEAFLSDARAELTTDQVASVARLQPAEAKSALQDLAERGFLHAPDDALGRSGWSLSEWGKAWLRERHEPSDNDKDVLRTLGAAPDRRAKPATLATSLGVQSTNVEAALERLRRLGLVERSQRLPGGWRLRSAGRSAIAD